MKPVDSASTNKNHTCLHQTSISTKTACMLSSNQEIGGLMEINKVSDDNIIQQPQPKKQVRRRLHTSKPYQQRLLNMAEARREIATALKFHRASMKQQQQKQQTLANNHHLLEENSISGRRAVTATTGYWPMPPVVPPPPPPPPVDQDNFNLVLPTQTLGLNLNFKDFNNFNTSIYYNPPTASTAPSTAKELAVGSGRWCKSLDTNGIGAEEGGKKVIDSHEDDGGGGGGDGGYYHPFEQVMEFPPWLINANENSSFQDLFDHHFSDEYSPDPALPCMDIGEIEDGEWLAWKDCSSG